MHFILSKFTRMLTSFTGCSLKVIVSYQCEANVNRPNNVKTTNSRVFRNLFGKLWNTVIRCRVQSFELNRSDFLQDSL